MTFFFLPSVFGLQSAARIFFRKCINLPRLAIILIGVLFVSLGFAAEEKLLTIVHTNDLHSHLQGFSPEADYRPLIARADKTMGGFSRIAAIIQKTKKERKNPVITLDSGDYTIGSLFHLLAREEAFELRMLAAMGYDVVGLGKKEFSLKPAGLAQYLTAAKARANLPKIVFAGAVFDNKNDADDELAEAFAAIPVAEYALLERGGLKIGIFGIMGKEAARAAAASARPVAFRDPVDVARVLVRTLKTREKADIVICLSHGGLNVDPRKSEDEILAQRVRGIDVIISGHTHHLLEKPVMAGETIIVQAGAFGRHVGVLDIAYAGGKVTLKNYQAIPVNSAITGDKDIQKTIDEFKKIIDRRYLSDFGLSYDKVLARTAGDLKIGAEESPLGNMITDAMRWYVNKTDSRRVDPTSRVTLAVELNGNIRDQILAGSAGAITVADLFRVIPLGMGRDNEASMGYPLVSFYLHPYEIKRVLEALTSVYPGKGYDYFLQVSGVRFVYNPRRVIYDRVTNIEVGSEEEGYQPLDYREANRALCRVVANIQTAEYLKALGGETYRFLDISPKDRRGKPARSFLYLRLDANKNMPGIQELKQWWVLTEYVRSFEDITGDGVPDVPDKYKAKLGRIEAHPSRHPVALVSPAGLPTILALLFFGLVSAAIIYYARKMIKKMKKRRGGLKFK